MGRPRNGRAGGKEAQLHLRAPPPFVAIAPEQALEHAPGAGCANRQAVEETQRMRVLPCLDAQRERPGTENETEHCRRLFAIAAHRERAANQPPARGIGGDRPFERPVGGRAQIDIQRIGLALGKHRYCGPAIGEYRLAHGQHIADRAVTAVDDEKIDPVAGETGQGMRDLVTRARLRNHDAVGARIGEILPLIAVASRIVDDSDTGLGHAPRTVDRTALGCRRRAMP